MLILTIFHLIRIKLLFQHGVKLDLNTTIQVFFFFITLLCATQGSNPGSERSHGEEHTTTPVFLPGEFRRRRSLKGYSPWDRKESDTTEAI